MSAVSLIWVFMNGLEAAWFSYGLYVLAFYTLMVLCIFLGMVLPKQCKEIKHKIYENSFGNRYMTDMEFRTHTSLYLSLCVNLLYVGVNVVSYVLYRSWWFVVLAVYYIILAVMRFLLIRNVGKNGIGHNHLGELKIARICSYILLTLNITLSGAVLMILYQDKGYEYHGILIYVMALYTFYITTSAIINLVKYRKYHSPVMTMTKVIALSAALVSMLSLETAMFSQFGQDMTPENKWLMIALTGAGVSMVVVSMSVYMIVRAHKEIQAINSNKK
jgi:phosphatidylglycerophosphate synthase